MLGGLTAEDSLQNVQGVPGLSRIPLLGNLFKSRRSSATKRQFMIFLRPIILRDAATEAAVSNEKYNFLRAEQLKMRENRELKFREHQPVLPELPPLDTDVRAPRAQDALLQPPVAAPQTPDGFESDQPRD